jgi:hypothetical protein
MFIVLMVSLIPLIAAVALEKAGEAPRALTAADYAQAEKFMSYNAAPLVIRAGVRPTETPSRMRGASSFWLTQRKHHAARRSITPKLPPLCPKPPGRLLTPPIFPS